MVKVRDASGSASATAPNGGLDPAGRRRVLMTLCTTVTVSYGVLYYAFPVLVTEMSAETGWSRSTLTAAFSGALLVAAVVGIPVGRWLDRWGPRWVMTVGSALAVPALLLVAAAPNIVVFALGWALAGIAMAATFYPPAFTAITRWHGAGRVRALTILTLAAGFASTIFAPATAFLLDSLGWQRAYVTLAVLLGVVTIAGHWWGLRGLWPPVERPPSGAVAEHPTRIARSWPFAALVTAVALGTFAGLAVVVNLVPMLVERGIDTGTAALILGIGGAGQVAGRLAYPALARRTGVRTRTVVIIAITAVTTALLGVLTSVLALIVAAVVAGMARGLKTLLHATAVTDRWGTVHYGRLTGLMNAPISFAVALGPWAGAAIAGLVGSYSVAFLALAGCAVIGAGLAALSVPAQRLATPTTQSSAN